MKKRYFVIPLVCLLVASFMGIFMTVFTTSYVQYNEDTAYQRQIEKSDKYIKFAEIRYKIDPNADALYILSTAYSPYIGVYILNTGGQLPQDFYEKSMKYNDELYNLEDYTDLRELISAAGVWEMQQCCFKGDYLMSMYLSGDTEKAKAETEEFINNATIEIINGVRGGLQQYLAYVYNYPVNKQDVDWALKMEHIIFVKLIEANPDSEYYQNAKFEGVFSNKYNMNYDN